MPDQPWGDAETLAGALNRVASIAHLPQHCGSLLVAIEGGVGPAVPLPPPAAQLAELQHGQQPEQQRGRAAAGRQRQDWQRQPQQPPPPQQQQLECFAWVVVQSPCGATSHARSASFPLPPALSELILRDGLELGAADDAVFGRWACRLRGDTVSTRRGGRACTGSCMENHSLKLLLAPGEVPCCYRDPTADPLTPAVPAALPLPSPACRRHRIKSGQGTGTIGKLTGGLLTRQLYYEHAALCALVPLMNPGLYQGFDLAQLPVLADRPDAAAAGGE